MKMYKMKLMNKISSVGTALFNQDYLVGEDFRLFEDVDSMSVSAYAQAVCELERTSV